MEKDGTTGQGWFVVVPVRGGPGSKSRLVTADRAGLADAMARDTVEATVEALGDPTRVVVVSAGTAPAWVVSGRYRSVRDLGGGLDAAARLGAAHARDLGATGVAVLLGDHPCLRAAELRQALAVASRHRQSYVPDAAGTGTALVASTLPDGFECSFGPGSAQRHDALGLARLSLDVPGLRLDVDDTTDLAAAARLGLGPHSRAWATLTSVQATIHTSHDAGGSALLDDGLEITWDLASVADSGLRHLRVGQRVSIELDDPGRHATRVWIKGIGAGEHIG